MNWPIGCGKEFQGVYDRAGKKIIALHRCNDQRQGGRTPPRWSWTTPSLDGAASASATPGSARAMMMELLDGAGCGV